MSKKKKRCTNRYKDVLDNLLEVRPVQPEDTFQFHCSRCGSCCHKVKDGIMLDSLDIFNLARHFRQSGCKDFRMENVILEYTHIRTLGNVGYPIFLINTIGARDDCVFLKSGLCSVQRAKPRACRLYPFSATPNKDGNGFDYFIVSQKPHHFKSELVRVSEWMSENFTAEDRAFTTLDFRYVAEQAPIFRKLRDAQTDLLKSWSPLLYFKYSNFDLDRPFIQQFERNNEQLTRILHLMTKNA